MGLVEEAIKRREAIENKEQNKQTKEEEIRETIKRHFLKMQGREPTEAEMDKDIVYLNRMKERMKIQREETPSENATEF